MKSLLIFIFITVSTTLFSQPVPKYKPLIGAILSKSLEEVYSKLEKTKLFKGTVNVGTNQDDSTITGFYQGLAINIKKFKYYDSDTAFFISLNLYNKKTYERFLNAGTTFFSQYAIMVEHPNNPDEPCQVFMLKNRDSKEVELEIKFYECPIGLIKAKTRTYKLIIQPFHEFRCGNE